MPKPGLYPRERCRAAESHAERRVYEALKRGMPEGWYAWHSLRIRDLDRFDGEGDFVLAAPKRGLLVLEVKGGRIEVRDGRWLQNGREMERAPRMQGLKFVHNLIDVLKRKKCDVPAFGVATCFPDFEYDHEPTQNDVEGCVLGSQHLNFLREALPPLLDRALPASHAAQGDWIELLHKLWGETWIPRRLMGARAETAERERLPLDAHQLEVLQRLEDNPRMLIEGGAGTGKSLLALEGARGFAERGGRVLLLCFTRALAGHLRTGCVGTTVDTEAVGELAKRLLNEAGQPDQEPTDQKGWEAVRLQAALTLDPKAPRWDAVVVDEAQDLTDGDWMLVEQCVAEGRLWLFRDDRQRFWKERRIPERLIGARFNLGRGYRTPAALTAVANAYATGIIDPQLAREAIERSELTVVACPSKSSVLDGVELELDRLYAEGVKPRDIAVLSLRGQSSAGTLMHADQLGRHRLVRADESASAEHIVADTFLRFKGLERAAIIITDLDEAQASSTLGVRMHIALTRALVNARVVAVRDVLKADAMLAVGLR